ncbi:hypothetical protein JT318_gp16 [Pseudomonas phage PspYZU01]|uniref:Uncharacterized protein n=1 Tax=Pseudomonas phage PspYZU01 TaxID=1983555 RepID=A0A2U7NEV9_9CAUD|nr:hypothetical protein JT318_gp16 [Pseudomonas phage PspYZU01]ASD51901.1 hypothetical protein PspYZU01_16 [Pseudomonas phage PspYZU01]
MKFFETKTPMAEGQIWRHHSGRLYRVVSIGYDDKGTAVVIHQGTTDGIVHVRSLGNFLGVVPATMEPRFVLVQEPDTKE